MTSIIEVVDYNLEVVEVHDVGPQGPPGPQGPIGSDIHGVLAAANLNEQVVPHHDGTPATEIIIDFGDIADDYISITSAGIEILQDITDLTASIELHLTTTGAGDKTVTMNIWIERSLDGGSTWTLVEHSLREFNIADSSSGWMSAAILHSTLIPAGVKQRMRASKLGEVATDLTVTNTALVTSNGIAVGPAKKANVQYIVHF